MKEMTGIWIRTANKDLLLFANNFLIEKRNFSNSSKGLIEKDKFVIKADDWILGVYSSKLKAIQILDSIELLLCSSCINEESWLYQMPESEV